MARRLYHKKQIGQPFHHENRVGRDGKELNANGVITDIDWREETITVSFAKGETEGYDFDQLIGCWNESIGNGYWHYVD